MPIKIFYFKGSSKNDPGHYWTANENDPFANGPFFSYSDAMLDAGLNDAPAPDPLDDFDGVMKRTRLPDYSPKPLTLTTLEYRVRTRMLAASMVVFVIMAWYGIYRLTIAALF